MQTFSFLGVAWWLWLLLVIVVCAIAMKARKATARATHAAEQERIAQKADAMHEGAKTRHEGGA